MQRKFDVNFKLSVVQMYLKHDEELHVIAERMGIHPSVILDWVKLYQYHGEAGLKTRSSHAKYETAFKEKVKAEIRKKASINSLIYLLTILSSIESVQTIHRKVCQQN